MNQNSLPKVIQTNRKEWQEDNTPQRRQWLEKLILRHGAVLIRGLEVDSSLSMSQLATWFVGEPMQYRDRITPRRACSKTVYTSTDAPAHLTIPQHSESTFGKVWPSRLAFACICKAKEGGETPLSDTRQIYQLMPDSIKREFADKGVCYIRNFSKGPGMNWRQAFHVKSRQALEVYCKNADIDLRWKNGDTVRTRQIRPALAMHPITKEAVWFNHVAVLHINGLPNPLRGIIKKQYTVGDYPQNAYFGDGSPIPEDYISVVTDIINQSQQLFDWQSGDLLLLDNMLTAHGRKPYVGERRVLVMMGSSRSWDEVNCPRLGLIQ